MQQETLDIIKKNYEENNIILDPHTAVGVGAYINYLFMIV